MCDVGKITNLNSPCNCADDSLRERVEILEKKIRRIEYKLAIREKRV